MASDPDDKFERFVKTTHAYKVIQEHPIFLDVIIPKRLVEAGPDSEEWKAKRPVMLYFHAGWLVRSHTTSYGLPLTFVLQGWWAARFPALVVTLDP